MKVVVRFAVVALCLITTASAWLPSQNGPRRRPVVATYALTAHKSDAVPEEEVDVIVVGSGLAGLSCASLLAHSNKRVAVLESHDAPGGCAHTWERRGFHFESGPSLYSGFSMDRSPNPLKNIFQIVEEDCE